MVIWPGSYRSGGLNKKKEVCVTQSALVTGSDQAVSFNYEGGFSEPGVYISCKCSASIFLLSEHIEFYASLINTGGRICHGEVQE